MEFFDPQRSGFLRNLLLAKVRASIERIMNSGVIMVDGNSGTMTLVPVICARVS